MRRSGRFTLGPFRLDADTGELVLGESTVKLTPKATAVLCLLGERNGELVDKQQLFAKVWAGRAVSDSALTSCIQELRGALEDDPRRPRYVQTLHRRGYRLLVPLLPLESSRTPRASAGGIVGRSAELRELERCLERARAGQRQIALVVGEAGIGKTTLLDLFVANATRDAELAYASGSCAEHYGPSEPYLPLLDALTALTRGPYAERSIDVLRRRAPSWLVQLPGLLEDDELDRLQRRVVGATRERMLRELADAFDGICADRPLLLRLEDLHWSDVSTLDWLAFVVRRIERARLLIVASARSSELPPDHPLPALRAELSLRSHCRVVHLAPLQPAEVEAYLTARLSSPVATGMDVAGLAAMLHARTEGNPLFMVTVTNDWITRGVLSQTDGVWTMRADPREIADALPDDLRRFVELQLDRLDERDRTVLQAASAAGATFSAAAVAAALGEPTQAVEATCGALTRRGHFLQAAAPETWPDGTFASSYSFRHALYRATLYDGLPAATRAGWHARIGDRLEAAHGVHSRERAAELAAHFDRGRDVGRAMLYHQAAGDNAGRRNAPNESIAHYRRALELLAQLPDSHQRAQREIALNIALGPPLLASRGWGAAEAERAYARAQELSARTGATRELFTALWGLWMYRWGQGELDEAQSLGAQLLELAQRTNDDTLHLQAQHALWATALPRGDLRACIEHATEGETGYDAARHGALAARFGHHDVGVCACQFHAWALALHGQVAQARALANRALALSDDIAHPFSRALALFFAAELHQLLREPEPAAELGRAGMTLAAEHGFMLVEAWCAAVVGWGLTLQGDSNAGIAQIEKAAAAARATGTRQFQTLLYALCADACRHAGQGAAGARAVQQGLETARRTGERFLEAELLRLRGELALGPRRAGVAAAPKAARAEAQAAFERAIELARAQSAHLLELRSLSSLLRSGAALDCAPALRAALRRMSTQEPCADARDARAALEVR